MVRVDFPEPSQDVFDKALFWHVPKVTHQRHGDGEAVLPPVIEAVAVIIPRQPLDGLTVSGLA